MNLTLKDIEEIWKEGFEEEEYNAFQDSRGMTIMECTFESSETYKKYKEQEEKS